MRARIRIPIYEYWVHLLVEEKISSLIHKWCPDDHNGEEDTCKAITILKEQNIFVFIRKEHLDYNTIAHEIDHVVTLLMRDIGMKETGDNEEAYAYLTGWLHGWTYETLRDKGAIVLYQDKKEPKI